MNFNFFGFTINIARRRAATSFAGVFRNADGSVDWDREISFNC